MSWLILVDSFSKEKRVTITEDDNVVTPIKPEGEMKRADSKSAGTQRDAYKSPFVSIRSYIRPRLNSFLRIVYLERS